MAAKEDTKAIREETARRYAEWVTSNMKRQEWDQAMLVRRSGLPKQVISPIVNGRATQPTARQIAGLARAFRVSPEDVLAGIGLWPKRSTLGTPDLALLRLYAELDEIQRSALLQIGQTLREAQAEYSARNEREEDRPGNIRDFPPENPNAPDFAADPEELPPEEEWPPSEEP